MTNNTGHDTLCYTMLKYSNRDSKFKVQGWSGEVVSGEVGLTWLVGSTPNKNGGWYWSPRKGAYLLFSISIGSHPPMSRLLLQVTVPPFILVSKSNKSLEQTASLSHR